MTNFEYVRTSSVKAAIDALAKNPAGDFIAGGTNLIDLMKKGVTSPTRLIDINAIPLQQIEETAIGLQIGALAINSDVSADKTVQEKYPLLSMALAAGASAQLRNMATVGGNMMQRTRCTYFYDTTMPCNKREPNTGCGAMGGYNRMHAIFGASEKCIAVHPSDMCVALAALNATVTVSGKNGDRKILFTDFHRLPGNNPEKDNTLQKGEMITGINIPKSTFNKNYYLKIRDRSSYAFALVSVALAMETEGDTIKKVAIALGGVAHKPWRLVESEKYLVGKKAVKENFEEAAMIAMKGAQGYGHNNFKLRLAPAAILEALMIANSANTD